MKIARVFPRRTKATPDDNLAFIGGPPVFRVECDEVHVSVAFSWDVAHGQRLAREWEAQGYPVRIGGPALDSAAGDFVGGRYLKAGWTITSRGCPNRCDKCLVPEREGKFRTVPIVDGWNVADNNVLADGKHFMAVCDMLDRQKHPAVFSGGLEARRLTPAHVDRLATMRVSEAFFAYDRPSELEPLAIAAEMLAGIGWERHKLFAYVLCGYDGDSLAAAHARFELVKALGVTPFAMFYRPPTETMRKIPREWAGVIRNWTRPAIIWRKKP